MAGLLCLLKTENRYGANFLVIGGIGCHCENPWCRHAVTTNHKLPIWNDFMMLDLDTRNCYYTGGIHPPESQL